MNAIRTQLRALDPIQLVQLRGYIRALLLPRFSQMTSRASFQGNVLLLSGQNCHLKILKNKTQMVNSGFPCPQGKNFQTVNFMLDTSCILSILREPSII